MTMTSVDLCGLGVADLARGIAAGEFTPNEVAEATLAQIDRFEPRIQAFSFLDAPAMRAHAATLTEEAAAGRLRGPLHGVPVGIKDQFHVAGMPTRPRATGEPEAADATPVARLRAAGAIIVGKTYMPVQGVNPPTRNPWNLEHTAGGSSSGSGAAVAARMVPVALGEQTGGSNIRPAAFCGIAGLKATYGRISRAGLFTISWSHDHPGIIARSIEDIALVYSVIGGPDPLDDTTLPDRFAPTMIDLAGYAPPRIGVTRDFFFERSEPAMRAAVDATAERLATAGADVREVPLPKEFGLLWAAHTLISGPEGVTFHARRKVEGTEPALLPSVREVTALLPATYYLQAQRIRRMLRASLLGLFDDVNVLLMPAAPGPAPKGLHTTGDAVLNTPWSFVGYPSTTVNGGLSPEGLPLGMQFVAPPLAEGPLLTASAWAEGVLGRLPAPPLIA